MEAMKVRSFMIHRITRTDWRRIFQVTKWKPSPRNRERTGKGPFKDIALIRSAFLLNWFLEGGAKFLRYTRILPNKVIEWQVERKVDLVKYCKGEREIMGT